MSQYTALSDVTAITASATKTLVGITAPARGVKLKEVSISFDGVDAAKVPVRVELVRTSTAGTATTGTAANDFNTGVAADTVVKRVFTVEPTPSEVLRQWYVTPAGGLWTIQWPLGDEVATAGNISLRVVTAAGVANNALAHIVFVE
jgi:hypothetical protein